MQKLCIDNSMKLSLFVKNKYVSYKYRILEVIKLAKSTERFLLCLSPEEKEWLSQKAKESGLGIGPYIKSCIFKEPNEITEGGSYIKEDELLDNSIVRDRIVKTTLSEEEYLHVQRIAGNIPLATFLRKLLLTTNSGKFTFEIQTDDIEELGEILSSFNQRIDWFIGSLQYRSELYSADILRLEKLLSEANNLIQEQVKVSAKDRKYIRKQGIKHLNSQIDKILASEE